MQLLVPMTGREVLKVLLAMKQKQRGTRWSVEEEVEKRAARGRKRRKFDGRTAEKRRKAREPFLL